MRRNKLAIFFTAILFLAVGMEAAEIKRPTADADNGGAQNPTSCTTSQTSPSMTLAYDTDENTSDPITAEGTATQSRWKSRVFSAWQSGGPYSNLTLKVKSSCDIAGVGGECVVEYSTNGGTNWNAINSSSVSYSTTTDAAILSGSQDLSQLRVRLTACGLDDSVNFGSGTLNGFDIRTEGVFGRKALVTEVIPFKPSDVAFSPPAPLLKFTFAQELAHDCDFYLLCAAFRCRLSDVGDLMGNQRSKGIAQGGAKEQSLALESDSFLYSDGLQVDIDGERGPPVFRHDKQNALLHRVYFFGGDVADCGDILDEHKLGGAIFCWQDFNGGLNHRLSHFHVLARHRRGQQRAERGEEKDEFSHRDLRGQSAYA